MRAERVVVCLILAGCGRLGFDEPAVDAPTGLDVPDVMDDAAVGDAPAARCKTDARYRVVSGFTSTYLDSVQDASWDDARAACVADGAHLAIAETAGEASLAAIGDWLGISDVAVEGEWRTLDGALATYLPWAAGQPDGGATENCVRLDDATQTIEDRACADLRDYTCECE